MQQKKVKSDYVTVYATDLAFVIACMCVPTYNFEWSGNLCHEHIPSGWEVGLKSQCIV